MAHFPYADPLDEAVQARAFFLETQRQKALEAAVAGGIGRAFGGR